jgi:hypothetical protein
VARPIQTRPGWRRVCHRRPRYPTLFDLNMTSIIGAQPRQQRRRPVMTLMRGAVGWCVCCGRRPIQDSLLRHQLRLALAQLLGGGKRAPRTLTPHGWFQAGRPGEPAACKYTAGPLITRARCNLIHEEQQRLEDLDERDVPAQPQRSSQQGKGTREVEPPPPGAVGGSHTRHCTTWGVAA